jgi:putative acetyltransferase
LQQADIHFYSATKDGVLAGCGAFKPLDSLHGELKSMRTSAAFLRQGIAKEILKTLIVEAKALGLTRLSLETGSADAFKPAQKMSLGLGFEYCPPFGDYQLDPYSVFMTKAL